MIKVFNSIDNIFTSNGDKVIIPTKAKVHKEDNGTYYLDLVTSLLSKMYSELDLFKLALFQMNIIPACRLDTYPNCKNNYLLKLNKTGNDLLIKIILVKNDITIELSGCTT